MKTFPGAVVEVSDGIDEKLLAPGGTAGEGDGSIMLTIFFVMCTAAYSKSYSRVSLKKSHCPMMVG